MLRTFGAAPEESKRRSILSKVKPRDVQRIFKCHPLDERAEQPPSTQNVKLSPSPFFSILVS
jgi:hypothetical protein